MTPTTALSLLCAASAYSMLEVGLVLEKKAADTLPPVEHTGGWANIRNFAGNRLWLFGFILTNIQVFPFWAALALGPMSLVSPMLGVGLVVLVAFSAGYLHEPITRGMYAGIALTIVGIVAFSLASSVQPPQPSWQEALVVSRSGPALVVYALLAAGVVLPTLLSRMLKWRFADVLLGVASGFGTSLGALFAKLMVSGFDPAQPVQAFRHDPSRFVWVLLFFLLLLAGNTTSTVLQQVGFQKGRAVVLAPIFSVTCMVLPALSGVVLLGEWKALSWVEEGLKWAALAVIAAGAALLSHGSSAQSKP